MGAETDGPDEVDLQILDILARDGRATIQEVADAVGVRRPTVHARVKRLEADGVLRGYHADVDPTSVGAGLAAFLLLSLDCQGSDCATATDRAAEALQKVPEVLEYHTIAGSEDALVKVRAKDVRDLERIATRVVSGAPGVSRVRTLVVLSTAFERRPTVRRARGGATQGTARSRIDARV